MMLMLFSEQIYAMPVFDMMETVLVKKLEFRPGLPLRLVSRTIYVGNDNACFKIQPIIQKKKFIL
jgi:hypothetical protein